MGDDGVQEGQQPNTTTAARPSPGSTLSGSTLPESTLPESTLPESTLPESTLPESTLSGSTSPESTPAGGTDKPRDYTRDLGVVEAITVVTRSCPSGVVVRVAEQALEAIKQGGPDVMKQQAWFVLTAMKGWRGDRAEQVHRSLTRYLDGGRSA